MSTLTPELEAVLARAAECRAEGGSWAVVARDCDYDHDALRQLAREHADRFDELLDTADRRAIRDGRREACLVLRAHLRSANPVEARRCAQALVRIDIAYRQDATRRDLAAKREQAALARAAAKAKPTPAPALVSDAPTFPLSPEADAEMRAKDERFWRAEFHRMCRECGFWSPTDRERPFGPFPQRYVPLNGPGTAFVTDWPTPESAMEACPRFDAGPWDYPGWKGFGPGHDFGSPVPREPKPPEDSSGGAAAAPREVEDEGNARDAASLEDPSPTRDEVKTAPHAGAPLLTSPLVGEVAAKPAGGG